MSNEYMSVGREINPETGEWVYAVRTNQLGESEYGNKHALFLFLDAYDSTLGKRWIRVNPDGSTQTVDDPTSRSLDLGAIHYQSALEHNQEYREYLTDILVTAVEGGIEDWADIQQYEPEGGDPFARITEWNDEQNGPSDYCHGIQALPDTRCVDHMLTLEAIERGIAMCRVVSRANYDGHCIAQAEAQWDAGYIDAIGASVIAQFALFGEIVYG